MKPISLLVALLSLLLPVFGQDKSPGNEKRKKDQFSSATFGGLKFRGIGPAYCSGRIADFAVNPKNPSEYYVAVACGHIWKTVNNGTTFKPIFDNYGSYSLGCLALDPNNQHVIWAGTGENNSQRALGYGDGVYKSNDGGRTWKNMGLKSSRQIGKILIDPRDSKVVYVAAEGSVWGPGGERGLYKTVDGGKKWQRVLKISEHTGVSDLAMDPRNPEVIYAAAHQRRRHVFTKLDGGPESAIYKTVDGGGSWQRLTAGLPGGDKGAIGLAISPVNPDVVYAIIEAVGQSGGFFRTVNRGASWKKMSDLGSTSPQYYHEIFCDPKDVDKVFTMDTITKFTLDGGRTWTGVGNSDRHVDDHALWIDPGDTNHLLIGGDGGAYESYDHGRNWIHKTNLPVTQFYRVAVDNSRPFYYVYGGTQDNNSMGGPSRTIRREGICDADWFVTNGGDGFWAAIDPTDPNIVYAESQYGGMVRYDRQSGESISIKPQPRAGEYTYRWNWNTPLLISPHAPQRIYCAANKVFRSEDRGNSWSVQGDDLTRQIDRNKLPLMGRVWGVDSVAKGSSTSLYGTIVSLAESHLQEDLLFAGTDDGLLRISVDGGRNWQKIAKFPGIPEFTYVSDICPSRHDAQVVFAAFDNRKRDDFKPYLLKSSDRGLTWQSLAANLPENGTVHTIVQDPVDPNLLFVGTEFGVFFTIDGGGKWLRLKAGLPTIAVRDMVIQEQESDLVLATFGRGFYILDDFSSLRNLKPELLLEKAHIFPVKEALAYQPMRGKYGQGAMYFRAKNPDFGAIFTYYLRTPAKTLKAQRQRREKKLRQAKKPIPYPTWAELRAEEQEESPRLVFTIADRSGRVIRRLTTRGRSGINRISWDLRSTSTAPVTAGSSGRRGGGGHLVMPGPYQVTLTSQVRGEETKLAGPVEFMVVPLANTTLPAKDRLAMVAFQEEAAKLYRVVQGSINVVGELQRRLDNCRQALDRTPGAGAGLAGRIRGLATRLDRIVLLCHGNSTISKRNENPPTGISRRLRTMVYNHRGSTSEITKTERDALQIVEREYAPIHREIEQILTVEVGALEKALEQAGAPAVPGRLPTWGK